MSVPGKLVVTYIHTNHTLLWPLTCHVCTLLELCSCSFATGSVKMQLGCVVAGLYTTTAEDNHTDPQYYGPAWVQCHPVTVSNLKGALDVTLNSTWLAQNLFGCYILLCIIQQLFHHTKIGATKVCCCVNATQVFPVLH